MFLESSDHCGLNLPFPPRNPTIPYYNAFEIQNLIFKMNTCEQLALISLAIHITLNLLQYFQHNGYPPANDIGLPLPQIPNSSAAETPVRNGFRVHFGPDKYLLWCLMGTLRPKSPMKKPLRHIVTHYMFTMQPSFLNTNANHILLPFCFPNSNIPHPHHHHHHTITEIAPISSSPTNPTPHLLPPLPSQNHTTSPVQLNV